MPKKRKNELVRCCFFVWRLLLRFGVWYADGRSNTPDAGRHSLGTSNHDEALTLLAELDRRRAEDLGLAPTSERVQNAPPLGLDDGRALYEAYYSRSRITGGVGKNTAKRYKATFDKFLAFAKSRQITVWNGVSTKLLNDYATHLEHTEYAPDKLYSPKTIRDDLTTIKQCVKWLTKAGHLQGAKPIDLPLRRIECLRHYCWRPEEVAAMVEYCLAHPELQWLAQVIIALACTGMRISELAALHWRDIALGENPRICLVDESGHSKRTNVKPRTLKSGRGRSFPIHPDLLQVLNSIRRTDAYVFHGPRGGRLKADTVRNVLIREVIKPLESKFPCSTEERGFRDGRLHSFRHFFCSTCANQSVPIQAVMEWLGHQASEMIKHYYHLHDDQARRLMEGLSFLGGAGGRSAGKSTSNANGDVGPDKQET